MTQFQLQGPQAVLQPEKSTVFQEGRTILPQQQITISQGIDLGKIGQAAANLGIEAVSAVNDYKAQVTEAAIKKQTFATDATLKLAAERGDWTTYDAERSKFSKLVKQNLGFDPDKEEQPFGKVPAALLANTRSSLATWDNNKAIAQGEYKNLVELDNLQNFINLSEADIQNLPPQQVQDYVDMTYRRGLEEIYRNRFGVEIFGLDPNTNLSKSDRALARGIESKWVDAQASATRAMQGVKPPKTAVQEFEQRAEVGLVMADERIATALSDSEAVIRLFDKHGQRFDQFSAEERQQSLSVAKKLADGTQGFRYVMGTYLQIAHNESGDKKPFGESKFNIDPLSDEAFRIVENLDIKPDTASKLAQVRKGLEKFKSTSLVQIAEVQKLILDKSTSERKRLVDIDMDTASTRIDVLEAQAKEHPELRDQVELEKKKALQEAQKKAMFQLSQAAPDVHKDVFETLSGRLDSAIASKNIDIDFTNLFTQPSFNLDVFGGYVDPVLQTPRFMEEYQYANGRFMTLNSKVAGDAKDTSAQRAKLAEDQKKILDQQEIIQATAAGRIPNISSGDKPTEDQYSKAAMLALSLSVKNKTLFNPDGTTKSWTQLKQELKEGDHTFPLSLDLFQKTSYWDAFVNDVQNAQDPKKELEEGMAAFLSGPNGGPVTWDDLKKMRKAPVYTSSLSKERVETYEKGLFSSNPSMANTTISLVLMQTKDEQDQVITDLRTKLNSSITRQEDKEEIRHALSRLSFFSEQYDGSNPFDFVSNTNLSDADIKTRFYLMEALSKEEGRHPSKSEVKARLKKQEEGTATGSTLASVDLVDYTDLAEKLYDRLVPGNGAEANGNRTEQDIFRETLKFNSNASGIDQLRTRTLRTYVDKIVLDEAFTLERQQPGLKDKSPNDFNDLLVQHVNKRLGQSAFKDDRLVEYHPVRKYQKIDMPERIISRSGLSGVVPVDQIVLASEPLAGIEKNTNDVPMKEETGKAFLGQFIPIDGSASKKLSAFADSSSAEVGAVVLASGPYISGSSLGIASDGNKNRLIISLAEAALGGRKDTASIIAAQYALRQLPIVSNEKEARENVIAAANRMRSNLLDGNIKLVSEQRESYLDPSSRAPTYVLYVDNKQMATFQPNSNSVPKSLEGSDLHKASLSKMPREEVIARFKEFKEPVVGRDHTIIEPRDMFIKDYLLSKPDRELSFAPETPGLGHNLFTSLTSRERILYRKVTNPDNSISISKAKQVLVYRNNDGTFSTSAQWQDYDKVYPNEGTPTEVWQKGYTRKIEDSHGNVLAEGNQVTPEMVARSGKDLALYRTPNWVVEPSVNKNAPVLLFESKGRSGRGTPEMVTVPKETEEMPSPMLPDERTASVYSMGESKAKTGLNVEDLAKDLGDRNTNVPKLLNSNDSKLTIVQDSKNDPTKYTTTFTKYDMPGGGYRVLQETSASNAIGTKKFEPMVVYDSEIGSVSFGTLVTEKNITEHIQDNLIPSSQKGQFVQLPTGYEAISYQANEQNLSERLDSSLPKNIRPRAETKPNPRMFDVAKALFRDMPPLFTDENKPSALITVDENKQDLIPNPKFFNVWKSMFRDFPTIFVVDPEHSTEDAPVMVANPRYFNLWKSLFRDYPSLFVEQK